MATCQNCNYKWTKKSIWKLGFSKNGAICTNCGQKQFISFETKILMTLADLFPIVGVVGLFLYPWYVKLSNFEEGK
ncbi:hypothetical protein AN960_18140 [Bacillus sp. FJAT-25509]|uniref:hypothetical protein n=1 Tax=Bacillaceae TaxID=186817 RepID=UPI0006F3B585|nr:hypothetical protein [Bacillus sp. FJAT-25509]KQL35440.1 hypothetical protein AN960_18140 [Bacillus sp. FJAT-25509]